ncbi:HipA-like protein [Porphyromonas gingivalis F0185]|uniref:type II toxin-antitoxin system HipA family toxin n=1 Tax=Porphyromonas gingivalis TaxID=837 RepID=UPI0003ACE432|nr:HipA domain-containing protein [Porphyromonas gingivalis]ERJ86369.1 HipA-like protein [Porphyromonas gingivalis F0185]PDP63665.1 type II toxin-antitoxin system HipA family toxin [Porphyromonas gingivalis]
MQKLLVYADFDWLKEPTLVGELSYESLRGTDSYGFCFNEEWLRTQGGLFLSADLNNYSGVQYTTGGGDIFGCFSDALPDRWGRTLLNRREQILAQEEKRPLRRLTSFDYLLGIDDYSRMGGFRFKESADADFINSSPTLRIPPLTDIRALEAASKEIEQSEERNELPDKRWIGQLIQPGTSLGGARPKASVLDTDGSLCIAKFPSRKDDYDAELWEHFCHLLAKRAGITVADTRVLQTSETYHTLISKRFDRAEQGKRIHFASAMTLLGLHDGDNAMNGYGYLDIVDFIIRHCTDVESNLRELYRRVVFNICIGNSDDHFRNHGFLLTPKGWTLSPAYDINPTLSKHQSLLVTSTSNEADLSLLRDASEEYMLSKEIADTIILEVCSALKDWPSLATRLGITKREIALFADRWELLVSH